MRYLPLALAALGVAAALTGCCPCRPARSPSTAAAPGCRGPGPARWTLLLCDEPLTSLDPAAQEEIVGVIDRHRREHGT